MRVSVLIKLLVMFPLFAGLMSCETKAPAITKSSSIQLAQAVSDQRVFDCGTLRPEKLPAASQALVDTLPPKLEGETEYGYRDRLTADQKGLLDFFNWAVRTSARWRGYCEA